MTMATQAHIEEFNPVTLEWWDMCAEEHLEFFLEANNVTDAALKRAPLETTQNLVAPAELKATAYEDIMALLQNDKMVSCNHFGDRYTGLISDKLAICMHRNVYVMHMYVKILCLEYHLLNGCGHRFSTTETEAIGSVQLSPYCYL